MSDVEEMLNSEIDEHDETFELSFLDNEEEDDKEMTSNSQETEAVSQPLDGSFQEIAEPSSGNECAICGKSFKRKSTLKRHVSIHSDSIRCNRCGTTFVTEDKLLEHNQKYHQKVYVCDECGMELKSKDSLQNHKIVKHEAEGRKYECPYPDCGKICVKKTLFEDHMNSHAKIKQHKCGKCSKTFTFRYDMTKHAKTCGGTEPSKKCDQCERTFSNYCNLNTHRAAVHNQKQYPCSCGKTFKYVTGLMKHRKNKKHQ